MRALDRVQAACGSRLGRRLRRAAYWTAMGVLVGVILYRLLPDYRLPDLGAAPEAAYLGLDAPPPGLAARPPSQPARWFNGPNQVRAFSVGQSAGPGDTLRGSSVKIGSRGPSRAPGTWT